MSFPKIDQPIFTIELPVSGEKVKFRPYLSKEEKILMMAVESAEEDTMIEAIKQIINNCALTEIDVDKMAIIDLEYFFLNLRARSAGEKPTARFRCRNIVETNEVDETGGKALTGECGNIMEIEFNLLDVKPTIPDRSRSVIMLTDKIGVKMKYPQFGMAKKINKTKIDTSSFQLLYDMIGDCIDMIFEGEAIYKVTPDNKDELQAFLDSLDRKQISKIEEFFDEMPELKHTIKTTCSKCNLKHEITLEGVQSFF